MYRLTRNFYATQHNDIMSNSEIKIKSFCALILGLIPFTFSNLSLTFFKFFLNFKVLAFISASCMMIWIKIFSYSQWIVWGKYVPFPSGDSINSRLAQYGFNTQPMIDLVTIYKALCYPEGLEYDEWNLEQWEKVVL